MFMYIYIHTDIHIYIYTYMFVIHTYMIASLLYDTSIGIRCPKNGAQFNKCGLYVCAKYALIKLPQSFFKLYM